MDKIQISKKDYDEVMAFMDRQCKNIRKKCEDYVQLLSDAEKEGDEDRANHWSHRWETYECYYNAAMAIRLHFRTEFEVRKRNDQRVQPSLDHPGCHVSRGGPLDLNHIEQE